MATVTPRRTKIVATIGPACSSAEMVRALVDAGMDAARLNLSHGTHDDHAERAQLVREAEEEVGRPLALIGDLQGPKLRVGDLVNWRGTFAGRTTRRRTRRAWSAQRADTHKSTRPRISTIGAAPDTRFSHRRSSMALIPENASDSMIAAMCDAHDWDGSADNRDERSDGEIAAAIANLGTMLAHRYGLYDAANLCIEASSRIDLLWEMRDRVKRLEAAGAELVRSVRSGIESLGKQP